MPHNTFSALDSFSTGGGSSGQFYSLAKLEAAGLTPSIVASETQAFPRIGYERLDHIRALDTEATVPAGVPTTVERVVIQGARAA